MNPMLCIDCGAVVLRSRSGCCNSCSLKRAHARLSDRYVASKLRVHEPDRALIPVAVIRAKREQLEMIRIARAMHKAAKQEDQTNEGV